MQMIKEIYTLYVERWHFFLDLTWEHLQISLMSIVIATMVGLGLVSAPATPAAACST